MIELACLHSAGPAIPTIRSEYRRALLARLATGGEATVRSLAEPFDMSGPAISKHLRVLERAGLVETGRLAQSRPRRLVPEPLQKATEWLEHYRPLWDANLERLDEYVRVLKAAVPQGGTRTVARRTRAVVPRRTKPR